ncbi:hypothetical protein CLHOM_28530 [Clostridium homopropionicum DSM 5847]|uniref:Uncharacterized protein n=1 Tax=Clostridium homopropionicum DSM 5847 TaxID=1121318 RepID=A0A0L6Z766_9CLOT|nr:hypothetical protein [Clostridium homopropionicum]KOA18805.1 hypothetical protein CLHOM_28530 [Clostridium homopropionicum DSM 5847]SFG76698.1 hypothetical protein SAMN04488501_11612 [Clostridium homopropionicum]
MILIIIYLIAGISQIVILYKKNLAKEMIVSIVFTIMLIAISVGIYIEIIPRNIAIILYRSISKKL